MTSVVQTAKEWIKAATWNKEQMPDLTGRTFLVTGVRGAASLPSLGTRSAASHSAKPRPGCKGPSHCCDAEASYACGARPLMAWAEWLRALSPTRTLMSLYTDGTWRRRNSALCFSLQKDILLAAASLRRKSYCGLPCQGRV